MTGFVDALPARDFVFRGLGAEQTAALVATYLRRHGQDLPRHALEAVVSTLAECHPCRR